MVVSVYPASPKTAPVIARHATLKEILTHLRFRLVPAPGGRFRITQVQVKNTMARSPRLQFVVDLIEYRTVDEVLFDLQPHRGKESRTVQMLRQVFEDLAAVLAQDSVMQSLPDCLRRS